MTSLSSNPVAGPELSASQTAGATKGKVTLPPSQGTTKPDSSTSILWLLLTLQPLHLEESKQWYPPDVTKMEEAEWEPWAFIQTDRIANTQCINLIKLGNINIQSNRGLVCVVKRNSSHFKGIKDMVCSGTKFE